MKNKLITALISLLGLSIVAVGGCRSFQNDFIGTNKAISIALERADVSAESAVFERAELDEDDGIFVYETEFYADGVEYEVDVNAKDGTVIRFETDHHGSKTFEQTPETPVDDTPKTEDTTPLSPRDESFDKPAGHEASEVPSSLDGFITVERAKEIALEKAGITPEGVYFEDFGIDYDDGIYHYEIEFRKGSMEYEIDIKADDGAVLSWESDRDD